MKKRFYTSIIMALVGLPLLLVPQLFYGFEFLIIGLLIIGILELYHMFSKRKPQSKLLIVLSCVFGVLTYLSLIDLWDKGDNTLILKTFGIGFKAFPIFLLLYSIGIMISFVFDKNIDGQDLSNSFLVMGYVVLGISSIMLLRMQGVRYIVYLLLVVMSTDIFAYFFGIKFGKHKMAPTISPKKSWEGAIAGTVFAVIIGTVFGSLYGKIFNDTVNPTILDNFYNMENVPMVSKIFILALISMFASCCAQIGDLVASKLKRTYQIKDFSNIFPGHGGVLDRFDSTIFTSIILVIIFSSLYLIV